MLRALFFVAFAATLTAQQPPPIVSPEVAPDGHVTFRLLAPKAAAVSVKGEWSTTATDLTRDERGLWSATIGPLSPERYFYQFTVDGVPVIDPRNPAIKGGIGGGVSVVTVPGGKPWELGAIPHGTLTTHWYASPVATAPRSLVVYTPPGYNPRAGKRYPVLYLLHGSGDTEREWAAHGNANFIADSLIAANQAVPMIIVMPFGHVASGPTNTDLVRRDLLETIIPLIEKSYRTDKRRAMAGLSMGGMQTIAIANPRAREFPWQGVFSGGLRNEPTAEWVAGVKAAQPKLLWIAIGKTDFLYESNQRYMAALKANNVPFEYHESEGGHTWINWREYLTAFLPRLFR